MCKLVPFFHLFCVPAGPVNEHYSVVCVNRKNTGGPGLDSVNFVQSESSSPAAVVIGLACKRKHNDVPGVSTGSQTKLARVSYGRPRSSRFGNISPELLPDGVSGLYVDIGDCQHLCRHCGALFWYGERLKGYSNTQAPVYNKCCFSDRIVLDPPRDPPESLRVLLDTFSFVENIRAYNQMFAITSFGAHVDDSVNRRRGPNVFKISGQIYHWIGSMCPSDDAPPRFL